MPARDRSADAGRGLCHNAGVMDVSASECRWRIARVVGAMLLAAYFLKMLSLRFAGAWGEYAVDGDQIQGAWQYWRYHVHGALPPGQLLTDYAFAYHSPPFQRAWMALLSTFLLPLTGAKITHILAWALLMVGVVYVVGKHSGEWLLGIAAGFIVARNPEMWIVFGTGIARSWGPVLCVAFLAAFLEKRHLLCLFVLVLSAGLYPVIAMACGLTYGAYTVLAGPTMRDRRRRMAGMLVAGLLIIALGKYQDLKSPDWWGPLVTVEQADKMPAWHKGGRFGEVPLRPWLPSITAQFARSYKENGDTLAPASIRAFVRRHDALLVVVPAALAGIAIAVDRWRRFRRGVHVDKDARFPWQFWAVLGGSLVGYFIARFFAFKFFLPQRQLTYVIPFLVQTGLPLLAWCGARAVVGPRRAVAVAVAVVLTVLPAFLIRGDALAPGSFYKDHKNTAPLFERMRKLPFDATIASDNYVADVMGAFTYHAAWSNRTMTHPFRPGLYAEQERRLVEQSRALYATSFTELAAFGEREKIDYFVYNLQKLRSTEHWMFQPAKTKIERIFAAAKGRMVLEHPPAAAVIYSWKDYRILDMKKLSAWVRAQGPEAPVGAGSAQGAPPQGAATAR